MSTILHRILSTVPGRTCLLLWRQYSDHDIAHQAAALAYYLLFSLFPLLILVTWLVGKLPLDPAGILAALAPILPSDVLALIRSYLSYISEHIGRSMVYFSIVFSVWFPMRATDCLMHAVRRAYGLGAPKRPILYRCKVLLYTVLLLMTLALTLLLATLSRSIIAALAAALHLPFPDLWGILRFLVLGFVIFLALAALYTAAQDRHTPLSHLIPGAILSTLAWIALSAVYSFYTEYISDYSAIYGALGAVIVSLIWLYLTGITLILGAECNNIPRAANGDQAAGH